MSWWRKEKWPELKGIYRVRVDPAENASNVVHLPAGISEAEGWHIIIERSYSDCGHERVQTLEVKR